MEVDASDSDSIAAGGFAEDLFGAATPETEPASQSSGEDPQSAQPSVDAGATDGTPLPLGSAAEDANAAPSADFPEKFRRYTDFIIACTAPKLHSTKWSFLNTDSRLRIEMPPAEFVKALEEEYCPELLAAIGLYERVGDELRLPSFLEGDAPWYVTIDSRNFSVRFFRDTEFLFPMMVRTAIDYAAERIPLNASQEPLNVFVVASEDDVEIMQQLGLCAVSSEGLESLGRQDVERLFNADQHSDCGWRHHLLLVDFDVAGLENRPTAVADAIIKRLADAAEVYRIDPGRRFGVCRPTAQEFKALELAVRFEEPVIIRQLFESWAAAAKAEHINSWRTHFEAAAAGFTAASAALSTALLLKNPMARRAEVMIALPAYRAAGRQSVIEKFYRAVESASDPFDHIYLIDATDAAARYFDCDRLVQAAEAVLADKNPPTGREHQEELLEQRQRCLIELRRIRRDLKAKR